MSNIVKVFIVLNFALSVVFVATAATLLGTADNWKKRYEQVDASRKKEVAQLNAQVQSLKAQLNTANEALDAEREKVNNLLGEKQALQKLLDEANTFKAGVEPELKKLREGYDALNKLLAEIQQSRDRFQRRMEEAESRARKAVAAQEGAEDEVRRLQQKLEQQNETIAQLEKDLTRTRKDLEHHKNLVKIAIDRGFKVGELLAPPPIEAVVQNVHKELNFVMLSVGREDKVAKGMRFHISRGGKYIGEVQVDSVYPKAAAATIVLLKPGAQIRPGDTASTRL